MTHSEFQQFIDRNTWIYAKTYASFCPHEYVVKNRLSEDEKTVFEQIVTFIRENGFVAIYGKKGPNRYYSVGDYYYWTMGEPVAETIILNRAKLNDYAFIETDNGVFVKYRGGDNTAYRYRGDDKHGK